MNTRDVDSSDDAGHHQPDSPAPAPAVAPSVGPPPVARVSDVCQRYRETVAIDHVSLEIPAGQMVGLIGPDGVGKSSLLSLIAGARKIQSGRIEVLGGDIADPERREQISPRIAYMPQGLGKNLYPTLSVFENAEFFGRLFGHSRAERHRRIADLFESTGLAPFADRPAGKLSGGMKQKLSLCCSLIHDPDLLILDEPTTGVDPLSRRQFWELITRIRGDRPGMSVLVATAYMDEAARFDWLFAMDGGKVLAAGTAPELLQRTGTSSLEKAFVALLPEEKRRDHREMVIPPFASDDGEVAIETHELTRRFGDFVAVDRVSVRIERGEIFGFLGSNGCGKTTTMKMLTGLLPASDGQAWLFGQTVDANDLNTRHRVGYMSQAFSLYSELTVQQNLVLHARLFQVAREAIPGRVQRLVQRFGLQQVLHALPDSLPLGQRQRLSLAVAMVHHPELLILDEPTSGVDPVARDLFWQLLIDLSRNDRVTIFISTHFMNEAERCDRISLMHAGKVLTSDAPAEMVRKKGAESLEDAFIEYLEEAVGETQAGGAPTLQRGTAHPSPKREQGTAHRNPTRERGTAHPNPTREQGTAHPEMPHHSDPSLTLRAGMDDAATADQPGWLRSRLNGFGRMYSYAIRESLELSRDPIRATLAMLGTVILMFIMGYGISMDVEDLTFAVLDHDQTTVSRDYIQNLDGSRYFIQREPLTDYAAIDRRMQSGEISVALEIPPGFARDLSRSGPVQIGVWVDGSMPDRGETVQGYVQGMHAQWLSDRIRHQYGSEALVTPAQIEIRYRYNPDVKSLIAMVPAVIPLLLIMIPAMLSSLAVVREKELGSIINFYTTPTTRLEFLIGKQIPYVLLGMTNFLLMTLLAVTVFGVPLTGSFWALTTGALLYVICTTAMGLLLSTFMRSQTAAIFGTAIFTMIPATLFSGLLDPVSSLEGGGALIGSVFPTTHFLTISRSTFSKSLGFADLGESFLPLIIAAPILIGLSVLLLKKQES